MLFSAPYVILKAEQGGTKEDFNITLTKINPKPDLRSEEVGKMDGPIRGRIIGTGSFLPDTIVTNEEMVKFMGIEKTDSWIQEKFGIETRRLDFDVKTRQRVRNFKDVDLAERAVRLALDNAGIEVQSVDHLIQVSCTPDHLHFMSEVIELHRRLGLRRTVRVEQIDSGCAGLAKALEIADAYIQLGRSKTIVVVASNLPSAFFVIGPQRYMEKKQWFSAVIFGDGAGAMVLAPTYDPNVGLFEVFYEVDGNHPLMDYPAGGAAAPTMSDNISDHLYAMDAREVREQFPIAMKKNIETLIQRRLLDFKEVARVYMHQANRYLVEGFADVTGLPREKVPININRYGNTSAASTLILLDEDRRAGNVKSGDLCLFLWVGAGMMSGAALVKL